MLGTIINAGLILLGSILGLVFKNRISTRFSKTITQGLALCVIFIGVTSAIQTQDVLGMILCMVFGDFYMPFSHNAEGGAPKRFLYAPEKA
jgi:uncharacterized membrane protein YqgA involved in biofilm formation